MLCDVLCDLQLNNPNSPSSDGHPPDFSNPALSQCATCNSSVRCGEDDRGAGDHYNKSAPSPPPPPYNETEFGQMHGCSVDFNGATPERPRPPCCQLCCPVNVTEQWYLDHPGDYVCVWPKLLSWHTPDSPFSISNHCVRSSGPQDSSADIPGSDEHARCQRRLVVSTFGPFVRTLTTIATTVWLGTFSTSCSERRTLTPAIVLQRRAKLPSDHDGARSAQCACIGPRGGRPMLLRRHSGAGSSRRGYERQPVLGGVREYSSRRLAIAIQARRAAALHGPYHGICGDGRATDAVRDGCSCNTQWWALVNCMGAEVIRCL